MSLDLSLNDIRDESAISLGQKLSQLYQLQKLKLSLKNNFISDKGMGSLITYLSTLPSLRTLHIELCRNTFETNNLFLIPPSLRTLHNESCRNTFETNNLFLLSKCLSRLNDIKELTLQLTESNIDNAGAKNIAIGLYSLKGLESLTLNLEINNIG